MRLLQWNTLRAKVAKVLTHKAPESRKLLLEPIDDSISETDTNNCYTSESVSSSHNQATVS